MHNVIVCFCVCACLWTSFFLTHADKHTDEEEVEVWEVEMDDGIQTVWRGAATKRTVSEFEEEEEEE